MNATPTTGMKMLNRAIHAGADANEKASAFERLLHLIRKEEADEAAKAHGRNSPDYDECRMKAVASVFGIAAGDAQAAARASEFHKRAMHAENKVMRMESEYHELRRQKDKLEAEQAAREDVEPTITCHDLIALCRRVLPAPWVTSLNEATGIEATELTPNATFPVSIVAKILADAA